MSGILRPANRFLMLTRQTGIRLLSQQAILPTPFFLTAQERIMSDMYTMQSTILGVAHNVTIPIRRPRRTRIN